MLSSINEFLSRQDRSFKIILARRTVALVFNNFTVTYREIYIRLLGASFLQLGLILTLGGLISSIISYPFGRLIDRKSPRNILIVAVMLEALVPLTFFLAVDWFWVSIAVILSSIFSFCIGGVENIIVANAARTEDRARCFSILATFTNIPPIVVPLITGVFLNKMGGFTIFNINILFIVEFTGLLFLSLATARLLKDIPSLKQIPSYDRHAREKELSPWEEVKEVMNSGIGLKRWLVLDTISASTFAVFSRYIWVYGMEELGLTPLLIGMMSTTNALIGILSPIPLGILSDKIGRVKTMLLIRPLMNTGLLIFLFTNDPRLLTLAWAMRGVFQANIGILMTYRNELVPRSMRGRWMGVREIFRSIFRIPAPLFGGFLYSYVSPKAPFLFRIACDLFIRVPILLTMPRTIVRDEPDGDE